MSGVYESVLVTGGEGALARAVVAALSRRGVRAVSVSKIACDITNREAVSELFTRLRPTLLLNCAAFTNVDRCEAEAALAGDVNGFAVGALAKLCGTWDAVLVHVSTDYVFDGTSRRPYLETDPVRPLSAYGRSKLLGEKLLRESPPRRWIIARTAWLYGDGGASFPRAIRSAAEAGRSLKVVSDQVGSPTYCPDLAEAILDLLDAGANGMFHLVNGGAVSRFEFAREVLSKFGLEGAELEPLSTEEWSSQNPGRAVRPLYSVLDTGGYTEATGKTLRGWEQALEAYRRAAQ